MTDEWRVEIATGDNELTPVERALVKALVSAIVKEIRAPEPPPKKPDETQAQRLP